MPNDEIIQLEEEHRIRTANVQTLSHKTEIFKTFVSFLMLNFSFLATSISLAITHDRLPDRKLYSPLPDVFLDNVEILDNLLKVSEIQIMVAVNTCIVLIFFHKHR